MAWFRRVFLFQRYILFQRKTTTPSGRGTHFWPLCALWVTPKPRKKVERGAVSFDALIPSGCKWCFCYLCWFKWRCVLFKAIYVLTYCNYIWLGWKNTWNNKRVRLIVDINLWGKHDKRLKTKTAQQWLFNQVKYTYFGSKQPKFHATQSTTVAFRHLFVQQI